MPIVSTWPIKTPEGIQAPGVIVSLENEKEEERLVIAGLAKWAEGRAEQATPANKIITAGEFAAASADKQKELLQAVGLKPDSKAEERVKQYTDWLEENGGV